MNAQETICHLCGLDLPQRLMEEERIINQSGLFDAEYYLQAAQGFENAASTPLRHYLAEGRFQGLTPNKDFIDGVYATLHQQDFTHDLSALTQAILTDSYAEAAHFDDSLERLTQITHIESFMVGMTNRCNLRCIYCSAGLQLQESHTVNKEISFDDFMAFFAESRQWRVRSLDFCDSGEVTVHPHWTDIIGFANQQGINTAMITNLVKKFSDKEIDVLSDMASLSISVESSDPAVYAMIRRGGKLERLKDNMRRIKEAAWAKGRDVQYYLQVPLSSRNIDGLEDLFQMGEAHGVVLYNLISLITTTTTSYTLADGSTLLPLWSMNREEARRGLQHVLNIMRLGEQHGRSVKLIGSVMQDLQEAFTGTGPHHGQQAESGSVLNDRVLPPGTTLDCIAPWRQPLYQSDSTILSCSYGGCNMGLSRGRSMGDVVNTPDIQELRRSLLEGHPSPFCMNCGCRSETPIPIRRLRAKVLPYCI